MIEVNNRMKKRQRGFWKDNAGITSIEIVLILVVLVALVIIFKDQIVQIVEKAFASISSNTDTIIS